MKWVSMIGVLGMMAGGLEAQTNPSGESFLVSATLGISALSSPSLVEYIDAVAIPSERLDDFSTAIEFGVSPEINISGSWSVVLDYVYTLKSYTQNGPAGDSEMTLGVHQPFVLVHHEIRSENTALKFGGGLGVAVGSLGARLPGSSVTREFRARGGGLKLEAVGSSRLDNHLYGLIGFNIRWVSGGTFRDSSGEASASGIRAGLGYISIGLFFGLAIGL